MYTVYIHIEKHWYKKVLELHLFSDVHKTINKTHTRIFVSIYISLPGLPFCSNSTVTLFSVYSLILLYGSVLHQAQEYSYFHMFVLFV